MKYAKLIIILIIAFISIILSICVGSVFISPKEIFAIFLYKFFNIEIIDNINKINADIVFNIRLSHAILAFFTGAALSLTGTIIQSVLRNPLASTYNLGIYSASGLGIAILIVTGINYPSFVYVITGISFSFIAISIILAISKSIDKYMNNNAIILSGMVISLFINALMSFLSYMFSQYASRILFCQFGSLSLKSWNSIFIIMIITTLFLIVLMRYSNILDIMTFGDDSAYSLGVDVKKMRIFFIIISSVLTSVLVSFIGIIGFIDLVSPHIARKLFSSKHVVIIPISALIGAILLTFSDILSRIVIQGSNVPIGVLTAIIGAPFFLYIFVKK